MSNDFARPMSLVEADGLHPLGAPKPPPDPESALERHHRLIAEAMHKQAMKVTFDEIVELKIAVRTMRKALRSAAALLKSHGETMAAELAELISGEE